MAEGGQYWDDDSRFDDDDLFSEGPIGSIAGHPVLQAFRLDDVDPISLRVQRNGQEHRINGITSPLNVSSNSSNTTKGHNEVKLAEDAVTSDTEHIVLDGSEITDCPICLETFKRPKALPCLHTFCLECLDSFIVERAEKSFLGMQIRSFPCPICRRDSSPLDPNKHHKDWADQFPTNNIMLELIRIGKLPQNYKHNAEIPHKSKSTTKGKAKPPENKYCGNCQIFSRKTVKANLRCEQCSVNLCETCDSVLHLHAPDHTRVYVDAGHSEIKIKLSPKIKADPRDFDPSSLLCRQHNLKFDCFCMTHKCSICINCMKEKHSTCNGVHTFKEYSRILRRENSELKPTLKDSVSAMDALVGLFKQHMSSISADRVSSIEQICNLRSDINDQLDVMETNLKDQISNVSHNEERMLASVVERCEKLNNLLNRSLVRLNAAIQDGDDKKIISTALFCHAQIEQSVSVVKEISGFHSMPCLSVLINPFLTSLHDIDTFGETNFVHKKTDLPSVVRKLLPLNVRSVREILRFSVRTHEDRSVCGITSALYLPNNQVILIDFSNKAVKLFSDYGHLVHQVRLTDSPWDICSFNSYTFAVTIPYKQKVIFIQRDPSSSALIRCQDMDISLDICCYGITFLSGGLVISCPTKRNATLFNMVKEGKKYQLKKFCKLPLPCWQLVTNNVQREVISTHDTENGGLLRVSSFAKYSEEAFSPHLTKGLRGCDVDKEGNVYICGRKSRNVVQVGSSSGNRVLLTLVHGLKEPSTIAVYEDKFLVAEVASNEVGIFELF